MIRFSKILLGITVLLLLIWQLPWCYRFFTYQSRRAPFTMYSSVINDFAITQSAEDGKGIERRDLSGNLYTEAQFDSILPMFYYRQLLSDNRLPDSINGTAINPRIIQTENFNYRHSPEEINAPVVGLYSLLESMSGRVELQMPDDVFRITKAGIEFVDIETNSLKEAKSKQFTEAMSKKGFRFPAKRISGNPTTHKEYDEGYILLDADNRLFHLKRVKGKPYVRRIELPEEVKPKYVFITEFRNRKTLGFLTDSDNRFYVLENRTYEVRRVDIPSFNPETDGLVIMGNLFDWTVRVASVDGDRYYAIDANDYSQIKSVTYENSNKKLPLELTFTGYADKFVKPRL